MENTEIKQIDRLLPLITQTYENVKGLILDNRDEICRRHTVDHLTKILTIARELFRTIGFPLDSIFHLDCADVKTSCIQDLASYESRDASEDAKIPPDQVL